MARIRQNILILFAFFVFTPITAQAQSPIRLINACGTSYVQLMLYALPDAAKGKWRTYGWFYLHPFEHVTATIEDKEVIHDEAYPLYYFGTAYKVLPTAKDKLLTDPAGTEYYDLRDKKLKKKALAQWDGEPASLAKTAKQEPNFTYGSVRVPFDGAIRHLIGRIPTVNERKNIQITLGCPKDPKDN